MLFAAEMMLNRGPAFPGRQVAGFKAGGGAAPAEEGERRGGQKQQEREAERTERKDAGHDLLYHGRNVQAQAPRQMHRARFCLV